MDSPIAFHHDDLCSGYDSGFDCRLSNSGCVVSCHHVPVVEVDCDCSLDFSISLVGSLLFLADSCSLTLPAVCSCPGRHIDLCNLHHHLVRHILVQDSFSSHPVLHHHSLESLSLVEVVVRILLLLAVVSEEVHPRDVDVALRICLVEAALVVDSG